MWGALEDDSEKQKMRNTDLGMTNDKIEKLKIFKQTFYGIPNENSQKR